MSTKETLAAYAAITDLQTNLIYKWTAPNTVAALKDKSVWQNLHEDHVDDIETAIKIFITEQVKQKLWNLNMSTAGFQATKWWKRLPKWFKQQDENVLKKKAMGDLFDSFLLRYLLATNLGIVENKIASLVLKTNITLKEVVGQMSNLLTKKEMPQMIDKKGGIDQETLVAWLKNPHITKLTSMASADTALSGDQQIPYVISGRTDPRSLVEKGKAYTQCLHAERLRDHKIQVLDTAFTMDMGNRARWSKGKDWPQTNPNIAVRNESAKRDNVYCYICGYKMSQIAKTTRTLGRENQAYTAECEHVLPVVEMAFICGLYTSSWVQLRNGFFTAWLKHLKSGGTPPIDALQAGGWTLDGQGFIAMMNEYIIWQENMWNRVYLWAHVGCNKIKNQLHFTDIFFDTCDGGSCKLARVQTGTSSCAERSKGSDSQRGLGVMGCGNQGFVLETLLQQSIDLAKGWKTSVQEEHASGAAAAAEDPWFAAHPRPLWADIDSIVGASPANVPAHKAWVDVTRQYMREWIILITSTLHTIGDKLNVYNKISTFITCMHVLKYVGDDSLKPVEKFQNYLGVSSLTDDRKYLTMFNNSRKGLALNDAFVEQGFTPQISFDESATVAGGRSPSPRPPVRKTKKKSKKKRLTKRRIRKSRKKKRKTEYENKNKK
jgi:hypothetical protein